VNAAAKNRNNRSPVFRQKRKEKAGNDKARHRQSAGKECLENHGFYPDSKIKP